jgi:hypothetical protein
MPRNVHDPALLVEAVENVRSGLWTYRAAELITGIKKSTLYDAVKGVTKRQGKGQTTVFTEVEERQFVGFLQDMERMRYPLTINQFVDEVGLYINVDIHI